MKTFFLLFDSLNQSALGTSGGQNPTPHFDSLAVRSTVFDTHYARSLACTPARADAKRAPRHADRAALRIAALCCMIWPPTRGDAISAEMVAHEAPPVLYDRFHLT